MYDKTLSTLIQGIMIFFTLCTWNIFSDSEFKHMTSIFY